MVRVRAWMRRGAAALATGAVLLCGSAAGAATFPEPDADPFYAVPADVASLRDGAVIRTRETTSTLASVPVPAKSWQVLYKTTDSLGDPTATVTTVMVPTSVPAPVGGPRPLLSYQIAEDGLGTRCAPSYGLRAGLEAPLGLIPVEATLFTQALLQGWTVITSDYQGPKSQYFGAEGTARAVLDGIRAARSFAPAGIEAKAPTGLWGYSAGANATLYAAQLQPAYAPDVRLAGAAYGGVVPDVRAALHSIAGGPLGQTSITFLAAVARSYPEVALNRYLSAAGRQALVDSATSCATELAPKFPFANVDTYLDVPGGIDSPVFDPAFRRIDPITFPGVPSVPLYDYRGTLDEVGPLATSRPLAERFCRAGLPVQKVELDLTEHVGGAAVGAPGALRFLSERFAGTTPTSTCGTAAQTAPAAAPGQTCAPGARAAPALRVSGLRAGTRRIAVRGRTTAGCDLSRTAAQSVVRRVAVSVARRTGSRCRFLTASGRLTAVRSCRRPVALRARGTTSWSTVRRVRLPAGRYRVVVSATDAGGRSAARVVRRATIR